MNEGEIIVHGHAGDITGLAARGGKIFVREGVGYRAGIHMKEYGEKKPALVIGGTAQDFLGEYMAGGILVVLGIGLAEGEPHRANFVGTGMHGGAIYLRGHINDYQLGKEVGVRKPDKKDREVLSNLIRQFAAHFNYDAEEIMSGPFLKLVPLYLRPYGRLYAY
jgi:glutamate synthase domain-containing protein 3